MVAPPCRQGMEDIMAVIEEARKAQDEACGVHDLLGDRLRDVKYRRVIAGCPLKVHVLIELRPTSEATVVPRWRPRAAIGRVEKPRERLPHARDRPLGIRRRGKT